MSTDTLEHDGENNGTLEAAKNYVKRGWPVLPVYAARDGKCLCGDKDCESPGKHPATTHGVKDAATNEFLIDEWFRCEPPPNIGIRLASSVVLDVDPRNGGNDSFTKLEAAEGKIPATPHCATGGGGDHYYFALPKGRKARTELKEYGPGLDVKSESGYVVAPPSVHASGNPYSWLASPEDIALAPAPEYLLESVSRPNNVIPRPQKQHNTGGAHSGRAHKILDRYVVRAKPGNRNKTGFDLARKLRKSKVSEEDTRVLMAEYARAVPKGDHSYTEKEALRSLREAYEYVAPERSTLGDGPIEQEIYYDHARKEYLLRDRRGVWIALAEKQIRRYLKQSISPAEPSCGPGLAPLDCYLMRLQMENGVDYAGPLAGYQAGLYEMSGSMVLVTTSPNVLEPKKGDWRTIRALLEGLLDERQRPYLYGWLKIAYEALRKEVPRPGQTLVLAGPPDCGKSLIQNLTTEILGGRAAKPYQFMSSATSFNSDLFGAEHLTVEDEQASTDIRTRRAFGAQIKNVTVNEIQRCHPKNRVALSLKPFWRLTVSVNEEPENLLVLPPFDESLEDKIILLKCALRPMPMRTGKLEERQAFWKQLCSELPAFLDFLVRWEIPADMTSERFGIKHYHNPEILAELSGLSPEVRLLSLIDMEVFTYELKDWRGTAAALESRLRSRTSNCWQEADRLFSFSNACGTYLARLSKKYPKRVEARRSAEQREWVIHPLSEDDAMTSASSFSTGNPLSGSSRQGNIKK